MKINMAALKKIKEKIKKKTKSASLKKKPVKKQVRRKSADRKSKLKLSRSPGNPIIEPGANSWESKAAFNPTALYHDGKVHVIYRAIGEGDVSVLGYASSEDGINFTLRSPEPVFTHGGRIPTYANFNKFSVPRIDYISGGGWGGGCEDPRLTKLGDTAYMIYTAFDGWGSVRLTLTSVSLDDFVSGRWNWRRPVFISPPGEIHKNWVIFPEKINDKYAILHSISPKIMVDYFRSLDELDGKNFIYSVHQGSLLWQARDRLVRGVGPAPIKTKFGWLILYHKMEKHDSHRYKLWAMILDAKNPEKILHVSKHPILEPDLWYENEGYKGGVVYSCGAVVKDGNLFVYYGGADKVSCVAQTRLDEFLKELVSSGVPALKNKKVKV
ncbi:hypothetical protein A2737_02270 [Candidatus Nomurabacteria bacterium RIFCSPHIGHO2_01_FULL_41_71]|nr:MAG: hypothetical protein A2737_02270 [Candidatus Nomurabacteria bacterium RIFCSPHIGHO2_01_FULL_41_71]